MPEYVLPVAGGTLRPSIRKISGSHSLCQCSVKTNCAILISNQFVVDEAQLDIIIDLVNQLSYYFPLSPSSIPHPLSYHISTSSHLFFSFSFGVSTPAQSMCIIISGSCKYRNYVHI